MRERGHGEAGTGAAAVSRALARAALCGLPLPVLGLLGAAAQADAAAPGSLYECRTIVTGTDLRDRPAGLARCFLEVLVKVSGDPALSHGQLAAEAAGEERGAVAGFSYHDRMSGLSHHDDQGSSDRPQDLAVRYDPARVDAVLARLGERPWTSARPRLSVVAGLRPGGLRLAPADRDDVAGRARGALAAAAARYGMSLALPPDEAVRLEPSPPPPSAFPAGSVPVRGTLTWNEADGGWAGTWAMAWQGEERRWEIRGASLDEAFRDAVLGAMAIMSGHGDALRAAADAARE